MTLIEAVKSGRPFRRSHRAVWSAVTKGGVIEHGINPSKIDIDWSPCYFSKEDILADDYEIQEEKKFVWAVNNKKEGTGWIVLPGLLTETQLREVEAITEADFEIGKTAVKLEEVSD